MNRLEEIDSMERQAFRELFTAARKQKGFVQLFNWGMEGLEDEQKEGLRKVFIEHGVSAPIVDEELELICAAISARAARLD